MERSDCESRDARFVGQLTDVQVLLLAYIRSLLPGDPAARDVAQQANATIWVKRAEFEPGTNFKAWVFSIARFEVLNYRKRQARDARLIFSDELEETIATELAATPNDFQERQEALKHCLQKLRNEDRELLLHRYSHSDPLADYAVRVGKSPGGLKVTLHRLRSILMTCIERQLRSQGATA